MSVVPPKKSGTGKAVRLIVALVVFGGIIAAFVGTWETSPTAVSLSRQQAMRIPPSEGKDVYDEFCAYCHGFNLDGKSEWFNKTNKDPANSPRLDEKGTAWRMPDSLLFSITKNGGQKHALPGVKSEMPVFEGVVPDKAINLALDYIKSRWPEDLQTYQQAVSDGQKPSDPRPAK